MAVLLWSSLMVGSKAAVQQMAVGEVVAGRFILAAIVMWTMVLLTRQPVRLRLDLRACTVFAFGFCQE
ncbi:MAG: hypothetical protein QGF09_15995 [Rhodospirillales bacterium]|nr:hypothetical protein [Rhodospirillales bacterium]